MVFLELQAGEYTWVTYKEVYDVVMKLAASISKSGIKQVT
jgi:long-chain acyl-CoA synthetase